MEINNDIEWLLAKHARQTFSGKKTEASVVCEYGIANLIQNEKILGSDISISLNVTSQFDDSRGVDYILKFTDEDGECFIGVDVKTSPDADRSHKDAAVALSSREREVLEGTLRQIKYAIDPENGLLKKIEDVPLSIWVFDTEKMLHLRDSIAKKPETRTTDENRQIRELGEHLLREIRNDCQTVVDILTVKQRSQPHNRTVAVVLKKYKRFLAVVGK